MAAGSGRRSNRPPAQYLYSHCPGLSAHDHSSAGRRCDRNRSSRPFRARHSSGQWRGRRPVPTFIHSFSRLDHNPPLHFIHSGRPQYHLLGRLPESTRLCLRKWVRQSDPSKLQSCPAWRPANFGEVSFARNGLSVSSGFALAMKPRLTWTRLMKIERALPLTSIRRLRSITLLAIPDDDLPPLLTRTSPLETCSNFGSHFECRRVVRARGIRCRVCASVGARQRGSSPRSARRTFRVRIRQNV